MSGLPGLTKAIKSITQQTVGRAIGKEILTNGLMVKLTVVIKLKIG